MKKRNKNYEGEIDDYKLTYNLLRECINELNKVEIKAKKLIANNGRKLNENEKKFFKNLADSIINKYNFSFDIYVKLPRYSAYSYANQNIFLGALDMMNAQLEINKIYSPSLEDIKFDYYHRGTYAMRHYNLPVIKRW